MGDEVSKVFIAIDGVPFQSKDPDFPSSAEVIAFGLSPAKYGSGLEIEAKVLPNIVMGSALTTGRTFARAVMVTVESGDGEAKGETIIRAVTLFDVAVVKYKFNGVSSFTLSYARSSSTVAWVPTSVSATRFPDQSAPGMRRTPAARSRP